MLFLFLSQRKFKRSLMFFRFTCKVFYKTWVELEILGLIRHPPKTCFQTFPITIIITRKYMISYNLLHDRFLITDTVKSIWIVLVVITGFDPAGIPHGCGYCEFVMPPVCSTIQKEICRGCDTSHASKIQ